MPASTANLLIGLAIGAVVGVAIGYLIRALQHRSNTANGALLDDYKKQLELERGKTENSIKLTAELTAMKSTVEKLSQQSNEANRIRTEAEAKLETTINEMRRASESIFDETKKIAGALSNSQTRGKFGEAQLELLLQSAGLREGHEYTRQKSTTDADSSGIPDITVRMPGGSAIFVDSKFPFDRFLEGIGEADPLARRAAMEAHAKDLFSHVTALAKRGYSESSKSPDYVVLFAPFESILSEALEVDPQILHKSFEKGITIATPTTMMALLRTVAYVFNQSEMANNATAITELAGTLLKRIGTVHNKIATLGKSIKTSERAFNDLVQSAEENMLRPARKMLSLGVPATNKLKSNELIDDELREIKPKAALPNGQLFDDFEGEADEVDEESEAIE